VLCARYGAVAFVALMMSALCIGTAEANRRCGFDRYGYHPPDFRGCYFDAVVIEPPPPPVVRVRPSRHVARRVHRARRPVAFIPPPPPPPFEGYYTSEPLRPGCYFDNGYDMRVHRICYSGW
jgi:hypothetical protein